MTVAVFHHPDCALHETGEGHPERPQRVAAVEAALRSASFADELIWIEAPRATRPALERVHAPAYVEAVFAGAPTDGLVRLDADTVMGPHSLEASLRAVGALLAGVDGVLAGRFGRAFCNVRPPGHHAERGRAMGFCLFDNVAVAAAHALESGGMQRVAIVDFDVHHGNGTEDIFADGAPFADRVLFCSSFEHPLYPGTGADTISPRIRNVPLPAGTEGPAFRRAVSAAWLDALDAFAPELLFFSAGFDAHAADPLANLRLQDEDYRWVTHAVLEATDRHTGGRAVSTLEGGYDLDALGRSAQAHVGALCAPAD